MAFTDDDLKRLKELKGDWRGISMPNEAIAALLARLEAAEAVIESDSHTERCVDEFMKNGCTCGFQEAINRWRKAAGK